MWRTPSSWPAPKLPNENPISEEKFELGRHLFYDVRLSGNGTQSCASCHHQALAFSDGRAVSIGSTGEKHPRNAQALVNVAYNTTLTWANPILDSLEMQIQIPMFGEFPIELGITGHEDEVLTRLRADARYGPLFAAAFPHEADPINFTNIVYALASFTRGLVSFNAPYDHYVAGDADAMSESAKRGMALFLSERLECNHCHSGFNLSVSTTQAGATFDEKPFFNTGLYNINGKGAYPPNNVGVMEVTNDPADMGRFRPPTLRNIALTAPYMHDGSLKTLEDVIAFYERGGRLISSGEHKGDGRLSPFKSGLVAGFELTPQERVDLLAFLNALTDQSFVSDPRFGNPFENK
jgi:cytochrome c peroxidase